MPAVDLFRPLAVDSPAPASALGEPMGGYLVADAAAAGRRTS